MLSTVGSWDRPSAVTRAVLRVRRGGRVVTTTGLAERPVRALHRALCAALIPIVPGIGELELLDEESRPITVEADGRPAVRVLLRFALGGRSWRTVGVERDPAAAMLLALRDAADYVLACGPESAPSAFEERLSQPASSKAA